MTNKIQRFIAFLLVLCIPIFAIAGCTNKDVANAANQATSSANGATLLILRQLHLKVS